MDLQKFMMFVPFEIGDIIKEKQSNIEYEIIDIQHTYSAKERTIIAIYFIIQDITTQVITTEIYQKDKYEIIKNNYEKE